MITASVKPDVVDLPRVYKPQLSVLNLINLGSTLTAKGTLRRLSGANFLTRHELTAKQS